MKSVLCIFLVLSLALTISCESSPSTPTPEATQESFNETNVNFMQSAYHFVKNTYKGESNPSFIMVRSYSSFDSLFGIGSVMGMDNSKLITSEKMKTGFVLSIIYQGNNIQEFNIEKVTLKNRQLQVYYNSKVTTPNASWTCNCHVTALINNCEFDSVQLFENGKPLKAQVKEL
jgi:hypothetical protein